MISIALLSNLVGTVGTNVTEKMSDIVLEKINQEAKSFFEKAKIQKEIDKLLEDCNEYDSKAHSNVASDYLNDPILNEQEIESLFNEYYSGYEAITYGKSPNELKQDFKKYMHMVEKSIGKFLSESDKMILKILDKKFQTIHSEIKIVKDDVLNLREISVESSQKLNNLYNKFIDTKPFITIANEDDIKIIDSNKRVHCLSNTYDFSEGYVYYGEKCMSLRVKNSGEKVIEKIDIAGCKISAFRNESDDLEAYYPYEIYNSEKYLSRKISILPKDSISINILFDDNVTEDSDDEFKDFLDQRDDDDENSLVIELLMYVHSKDFSSKFKFYIFINTPGSDISLNNTFSIENVITVPLDDL